MLTPNTNSPFVANRHHRRVVDTLTSYKSETVWFDPDGTQLVRIAHSDTAPNSWTTSLDGYTGFGPTLREAYRAADRKRRVARHDAAKLLRQRARFGRAAVDSRVHLAVLREIVSDQARRLGDLAVYLERQTTARQRAEAALEKHREDTGKVIARLDHQLREARRQRAAQNHEAVIFVTVNLSAPESAQNELSSLMFDGWRVQHMATGGDQCVIMLTNMGNIALERMRPGSKKPSTAYESALQNGVSGAALSAIGDREALDQARQVFDAAPKPPARRALLLDNGARHDR